MIDTPLYIPPKECGFANRLIHLTDFFTKFPNGIVHESIRDYGVGQWFDFSFPLTTETESTKIVQPNIYIGNLEIHSRISSLVKPNKKLIEEFHKYANLIQGVRAGLHIRRGLSSKDYLDGEIVSFANDNTVAEFEEIAKHLAPVYVSSDSESLKKEHFSECRTLHAPVASIFSNDKLYTFIEFLLLSYCPVVFVTEGGQGGVSTFGYMAACYGRRPIYFVRDQTFPTLSQEPNSSTALETPLQ